MKAFQNRVIKEKQELVDKLERLQAFILTGAFDELDEAERERLYHQRDIMEMYVRVLAARVSAFKKD